MSRRTIAVSALVAVAIAAIAAVPLLYAGPHSRGHSHFGGIGALGHLQHVKAELNLSDQQMDEIKVILKELRERNAPYHEQMHGGIASIVETLVANPSDVAAAQALLAQQTQAEDAMKANVLSAASKALSVLTPEQRTKVGAMVEKHKERWHERRRG
jgi:periplasmic protein CpxP/Spy